MAYTVLARKYRSQTFEDVIGQEPIARTLKNAIESDRVAHAYLFSGTRGVGKTTMARILAKALNCLAVEEPTTTPCCKCESCVAINSGDDIDVIEIDGASNRGIDEVRELRQNAIYRPARARFKIYIIDEVHMLTVQAFNALLKTLEEPPDHVKFIFATTEPNKVIATIQSRCQRFDFGNIRPGQIADQLRMILKKEKIEYNDDLIVPLARMANGSMRDGLSLLDRLISTGAQPLTGELLEEFLGRPNVERLRVLAEAIADSDAAATLNVTEELIGAGFGEVLIVDSLIDCLRDLMVLSATGLQTELLGLTEQQKQRAAEVAEKFDTAALVYGIATLEKLRWAIKNSDTPRALLDAAMLRLTLSEHFMNVDELLARATGQSAAPVKKKAPVESKPSPSPAAATPPTPMIAETPVGLPPTANEPPRPPVTSTGDSPIEKQWPLILDAVAAQLGSGTAGLLAGTRPGGFADGVLTVRFDASAQMQKQMCERNGRAEQIQKIVGRFLAQEVKLQLELASTGESRDNRPKSYVERQRELINDPAVKEIIGGLDATITGVEER